MARYNPLAKIVFWSRKRRRTRKRKRKSRRGRRRRRRINRDIITVQGSWIN